MAELPALPLWTDAYLADTGHLTTIEHGAYLLLLMAMWRAGGSLPNDDKRLARFAHLNAGQWQRIRSTMMEFFNVEGDQIVQGRLTDELEYVRQHRAKQSNNARAKYRKNNKVPTAMGVPNVSQNAAPTPTPTPNTSSLRSDIEKASPRDELEKVLDKDRAGGVLDHRQRIRKPLTARAATLLANKFSQCPDPNAAADAMVSNGWQGFEPEWMERQPRAGPMNGRETVSTVANRLLKEMENAESPSLLEIDYPSRQRLPSPDQR